jgi:repressor LexA
MTTARLPLTQQQNKLMQFLRRKIQEDGFPPTIQEICTEFGFKSTNGVSQMLQTLETKGYIKRREKGASRGIQLLGQQPTHPQQSSIKNLVLIGIGTADEPLSAFLNPHGQISLDIQIFSNETGQFFAAEITDDGMSAEHILAGDIAVCLQQVSPAVGSIVAAIHRNIVVIRRLAKAGELQPASKGFPRIVFSKGDGQVAILGKVVGVIRKI